MPRLSRLRLGGWALVLALLAGCAAPRFVEVDKDGGVMALPSNTNYWPCYHRDKAEAMLQKRFPQGYEIVHEGEFVTGTRADTHSETDTREAPALVLAGGETKTEKTKGGERTTSKGLGGLAIPLGQTESTTRQHTTYSNITEWRIHVRAKLPGS